MFSVDNFYTIFNSYYGWPAKNTTLYMFRSHGSKDWADIIPRSTEHVVLTTPKLLTRIPILMHDQEPFSAGAPADFLRHLSTVDGYQKIIDSHPIEGHDTFTMWHNRINELGSITIEEFMSLYLPTYRLPIICHSEKNSQDIAYLEKHHWVSCYYWWHGMVARDWFRHWERHKELEIKNKSQAQYRFLIYSRDHTGTRKYRSKVIKHLKQNYQQVNYNWWNDHRCPTLSATIDIDDANNSAIHLVAETLFDTQKIYLTEKVFKPMVMSQPFILFAPPGSLQYLRDYGFKTFDDIWSEDYDSIADAAERKQVILNLIDYLIAMPAEQFDQLYQKLLPIVEHNRKHFYSSDFQNTLWKELQKNCSDALLKQQELSKQLPGGTWAYNVNQIFERNGSYIERWHTNLDYLVKGNHTNVENLKLTYPKLFKHYQSQ